MTNSADPDQLASTLFANTGHIVLSKRKYGKYILYQAPDCGQTKHLFWIYESKNQLEFCFVISFMGILYFIAIINN